MFHGVKKKTPIGAETGCQNRVAILFRETKRNGPVVPMKTAVTRNDRAKRKVLLRSGYRQRIVFVIYPKSAAGPE